jgi:hypothetical protein
VKITFLLRGVAGHVYNYRQRNRSPVSGSDPRGGTPPHATGFLRPGEWVVHPLRPDWGRGQVQSVVGPRVTVNFEHAGKVLVNTLHVALEPDEG